MLDSPSPSDDPKELHVALHDGYSIKKLREFLKRYGPYVLKTLGVVQVLLSVGGFVLTQLAGVSTAVAYTVPLALQSSANFYDMKEKTDLVQNFLENPENKLTYTGSSLIQKQKITNSSTTRCRFKRT